MIRSWGRSPLPSNQQDAQRIQVSTIHATVPRTSGREIHRYKAYATQQPRRPR